MITKPVYELLPYIYISIGVLSLVNLENGLGKSCGLLLITSGLLIHHLRSKYRKRNQKCR